LFTFGSFNRFFLCFSSFFLCFFLFYGLFLFSMKSTEICVEFCFFSGEVSVLSSSISLSYFPSSISCSTSEAGLLSTKTPKLTQLPTTVFTAVLRSLHKRFGSFVFATEIICSIEAFATCAFFCHT